MLRVDTVEVVVPVEHFWKPHRLSLVTHLVQLFRVTHRVGAMNELPVTLGECVEIQILVRLDDLHCLCGQLLRAFLRRYHC